jgi:hypothetical protein
MLLRQFLYLDDRLVREFLAQAEGGTYKERHETSEAEKSGKVGGKIGASLLGVEAGGGVRSTVRSDRVLEQTAASEFNRLHELLSKNKLLTEISSIDESTWGALKRGQFVEIEAAIALSGMATIRHLTEGVATVLPVAESLGSGLDPEKRAAFELWQRLGVAAPAPWLPVVVRIAGGGKYKFRARLDRVFLQCDESELVGEAVVVAKLGRKIERGQTLPLEDIIPGIGGLMTDSSRRKMERGLRSNPPAGVSLDEMSLSFPAADLVPLAVFR